MDNHLAASWCWLQLIDPDKSYRLFHIDRHYDFLNSQTDKWLDAVKAANLDLTQAPITAVVAVQYKPDGGMGMIPVMRWDNYLPILFRLYPDLFDVTYFATHKDGNRPNEHIDEEAPGAPLEFYTINYEPEIYELQGNLSHWLNERPNGKWVVNLDIDYFFTDKGFGEDYYQFLSDEYVKTIAEELVKAWDNIEVFTLALSPEMCGGWDNAIRVARLITDRLAIPWPVGV
jgi:hypothetical protein